MAGGRTSSARVAAVCRPGGERAAAMAGAGTTPPTLEDAVLLRLANPAGLGCIVCGGAARRKRGGVECLECRSVLSWGAARGVWVP